MRKSALSSPKRISRANSGMANAAWNRWERGAVPDLDAFRRVLEWAATLHQRLPHAPAVSGCALLRLARYQALARMYRLPSMLRRFRQQLGAAEPLCRARFTAVSRESNSLALRIEESRRI